MDTFFGNIQMPFISFSTLGISVLSVFQAFRYFHVYKQINSKFALSVLGNPYLEVLILMEEKYQSYGFLIPAPLEFMVALILKMDSRSFFNQFCYWA